MSRWFRFFDGALDDPAIQRLDPVAFREALYGAVSGEDTPFTRYLRRGSDRPSAVIWAKLRAFVFQRDGYACGYCGERGGRLECDHVVPVSRGGSNNTENLKAACFRCNRSKRSKLIGEWMP